jgi:hypothetical protein
VKRLSVILTSLLTLLLLSVVAAAAQSVEAPPGDARVRVAHASPDAPNVDVYVDGGLAFENVPFEDLTAYAVLPAGSYQVQVAATGTMTPVISATLPLAADTDYTVAAVNEVASIEPVVLTDDNTLPMDGMSHIRFFHASPDAPAVDIALDGGAVLFADYEFKETSPYQPYPADTYDLEVRLAGTNTVVLDLPPLTFDNKTVYTVVATGFAGGGTPALNAIVSEDAGPANVRVAHLSPDAPPVDVLVNGGVAFPGASFEAVTDYAELPSNSYFIEVVEAGTTGPAVISATLPFAPNQDYTVAAVNTLGSIEPLVLEDDNTLPAPGEAHIRFVHASPDAPAVDIALDGGAVLFGDYEFKEVSGYQNYPADTYDLEVRLAGTTTVALDLPPLTFEPNTVYTVFATGFAGDGTPPLNAILTVDAQGEQPTDVALADFGGESAASTMQLVWLSALLILLTGGIALLVLRRQGPNAPA